MNRKAGFRFPTLFRLFKIAKFTLNSLTYNLPFVLKKYLLLLPLIILISFAHAQEKKLAIISGVLKDARSKLPLNEAIITLSSSSFKGQKIALTDSSGKYRINNLPAGTYTISFEMEGYEKFTHENLLVREGMSLGVSFEMAKERKNVKKSEQIHVADTTTQ